MKEDLPTIYTVVTTIKGFRIFMSFVGSFLFFCMKFWVWGELITALANIPLAVILCSVGDSSIGLYLIMPSCLLFIKTRLTFLARVIKSIRFVQIKIVFLITVVRVV